jgi:hypothetical protein
MEGTKKVTELRACYHVESVVNESRCVMKTVYLVAVAV